MEVKLLLIGALCLILTFTPIRVWQKCCRLFDYLDVLRERWRQFSSCYQGKSLQREIGKQLGAGLVQTGNGLKETPQYKFYTELFLSILKFGQNYGTPLRRPLLYLQRQLSEDLDFEQKVVSLEKNAYVQFVMIALVIWFFTFAVGSTLNLARNFIIDGVLFLLQMSGIGIFLFLKRILKKQMLGWFQHTIPHLCFFDILLEVPLACSEVVRLSKITIPLDVFEKHFSGEFLRLTDILRKWQETGAPIREEWEVFLQDIWNLAKKKFESYTKYLQVIKFLVLALFFLSSYFIYLSSLFDQLFA